MVPERERESKTEKAFTERSGEERQPEGHKKRAERDNK